MQWYMDYARRTEADGAEGRVISLFRFTEDWGGWEMHPAGDEVVVCLTGEMRLTQEFPDGRVDTVTLGPRRIRHQPAQRVAHGGYPGRNHGPVRHRRGRNAKPPALISRG